jgi:hypothetical protein
VGKRSDFKRLPQDKYMTTDPGPVRRLQPHLARGLSFAEPCAGNGDLIASMKWHGHSCVYAGDVRPGRKWIEKRDALSLDKRWRRSAGATVFVTNPPWTRELLHEMIEHLPSLLPTWLLIDADWMHTRQAAKYVDRCSHIVSLGRVQWFKGSANGGLENSAWYFFPHRPHTGGPRFTGLV